MGGKGEKWGRRRAPKETDRGRETRGCVFFSGEGRGGGDEGRYKGGREGGDE